MFQERRTSALSFVLAILIMCAQPHTVTAATVPTAGPCSGRLFGRPEVGKD
jgi:hypothetical protein